MELIIVGITALSASLLTFFSGFGLGTIMLPVMALFFPLEIAIAATAVIHLLNNLFKVALIGNHLNKEVLFRFGITAIVFSFLGALLLGYMGDPILFQYQLLEKNIEVSGLKVLIGSLMILFSVVELLPSEKLRMDPKWLPFGGMLSGFFGGLSGHQGALRSMFLIKVGLSKEAFVATGIVIAILIDISRLTIYGKNIEISLLADQWTLLTTATLSAFAGAIGGKYLLKKVTITFLNIMVSSLVILFSLALILGWV